MAMTDFFYTCYHIETETVPDGVGGVEVYEILGTAFPGLAVKMSTDEQPEGAMRGREGIKYHFHCLAGEPLEKDDRVQVTVGGDTVYLRMTDSAHINPARSHQRAWKSFTAVSYQPAKGGL